MQTNRLLPQFKQWASLCLSEQIGQVSLHRNFKLLLTQIFCRRLNLEQGTVSLEVGLSYDLLRFIPCSTICSHPFRGSLHWGVSLFDASSSQALSNVLLYILSYTLILDKVQEDFIFFIFLNPIYTGSHIVYIIHLLRH